MTVIAGTATGPGGARAAHGLAAPQSLGSLVRARLKTFKALSRVRHGRNAVAEEEPARIEQVRA